MNPLARAAAVLSLFVALAVAHTWPLASAPSQTLPGSAESYLHVWELNIMARQLMEDPLRPVEGNTFYPFSHTLAAADHVFATALLAVPLRFFGMGPIAIYNLTFIATFALSGLFCWLLVVRLTGSSLAGVIAGSAYAFSTLRWNHISHLHILVTQFLPLALFALHVFLERRSWASFAGFTASAVAVALSSWHLAVIGGIGIGVVALWSLAGSREPKWLSSAAMLLLASIIAGVSLIPLIGPYRQFASQSRVSAREPSKTAAIQGDLSLRVEGLFAPAELVRSPHARWLIGFGDRESRGFPGAIVVTLCALGILLVARESMAGLGGRSLVIAGATLVLGFAVLVGGAATGARVDRLASYAPMAWLGLATLVVLLVGARRVSRAGSLPNAMLTYLALSVCGALLAFGPRVIAWGQSLGSGVTRGDLIPMLLLIRAPARFSLLAILGAAVVAGIAFARLERRMPRARAAIVGGLIALAVNLEAAVAPLELRSVPRRLAVHEWLSDLREPGAVIEYPRQPGPIPMFGSLFHRHPLVNGLGYYVPQGFAFGTDGKDLSPAEVDSLWELAHPRFVVVRSGDYPEDMREIVRERIAQHSHALRLRARFGNDFVYELFDRGAGPLLVRRWPGGILSDSRGLELTGAVSEVPAGRISILAAEFNAREVLRVEGPAAEQPILRRIEPPEQVRPGQNVLAIRGDYRFDEGAAGNPIGATGTAIAADLRVLSARERGSVQVNGRVLPAQRGYTIVVLDRGPGGVREVRSFNTSSDEANSAALVDFVQGIPPGTPVVVASENDVSRRLTAEAVAALRELGLNADLRDRFRRVHAGIGVKGAKPGTALELTDEDKAELVLGVPSRPKVSLTDLRLIEDGVQ